MSKKRRRRKGRCDNSRTRDIVTRVPFGINNVSTKFCPKKYPPDDIYKRIFKKNSHTEIQKFVFNPSQWKNFYFNEFKFNHGARRNMKQMIMYDTVMSLMRGKYFLPVETNNNNNNSNKEVVKKKNDQKNEEEEEEEEGEYGNDFLNPSFEEEEEEDDFNRIIETNKVFLHKKMLIKSVKSVKYYSNEFEFSERKKDDDDEEEEEEEEEKRTEIVVVEGDCLEETIRLKKKSMNPVMLIMCSRTFPGGKFEKAPKSQEESICRRSNLFMCLSDPYSFDPDRNWSYPHPEFGSVYIPHCIVFRSSESNGYEYFPSPINLSMLTQFCYAQPPVEKKEEEEGEGGNYYYQIKGKKLIRKYIRKMEVILDVALENHHDCIVLSAFGCGVYENPPKHIAQLFKKVIFSDRFRNKFKMIVFSILGGNNGKNLNAFQEVFSSK